jgi:integrase/recombinase XerD
LASAHPNGNGGDSALIERFLEMLAAERGVARNTLLAYGSDLSAASDMLAGELAKASKDKLAILIAGWSHLANSSIARKAAALRGFFGFLEEEGFRPDNPSAALPRPVQTRALPKVLEVAEVEALFASIEARLAKPKPSPLDYRLSALVELLYGSGLRASELVALPRTSIVRDRPYIILKGKGDKERLVPISDRARDAVGGWHAFVPRESRYLFPSRAAQAAGKGDVHISRILCHAFARRRGQFARIAGDVGPCRYRDHADIYACGLFQAGRTRQPAPPAC